MHRISESPRINMIEKDHGRQIKEILYHWHWNENLMHKEIATRLNIPRPTITRWFKNFGIPSQPCNRITNLNLLNVGPIKSQPAKLKIKKERPWKINEEFFQKWTPEFAYFVGFFCADGCMFINPRGSRYISFNITDKDLLVQIKNLICIGHTLSLKKRSGGSARCKPSWNLQIGSKKIFNRFLALGITPKKSKRIRIPKIPKKYLPDFIRGYFDGDGGVYLGYTHKLDRKHPVAFLHTTFTSCSEGMIRDIAKALHDLAQTKLTVVTFRDGAYRIGFSVKDSLKIYRLLYGKNHDLYLERKKIIFERYMSIRGPVA